MGTGSFTGVEIGRGMTLTPHFLLVQRSKKQSIAIPVACKKGETHLQGYRFVKIETLISK
jgi:hypothetical protein